MNNFFPDMIFNPATQFLSARPLRIMAWLKIRPNHILELSCFSNRVTEGENGFLGMYFHHADSQIRGSTTAIPKDPSVD
jgi:hypothetical protein